MTNKEDYKLDPKSQLWRRCTPMGRPVKFENPSDMWDQAVEYFKWADENPLMEYKVVAGGNIAGLPKMRAMTEMAMCLHMDIGWSTWDDYKNKSEFSEVTSRIANIIRTQKFEGAAADFLNANIIARDLGLRDAHENENTNTNMNANVDIKDGDSPADALKAFEAFRQSLK